MRVGVEVRVGVRVGVRSGAWRGCRELTKVILLLDADVGERLVRLEQLRQLLAAPWLVEAQ